MQPEESMRRLSAAVNGGIPRWLWRASGIYQIRHIETGRMYVGSAKVFVKRRNAHLGLLRRGKHMNRMLQRAWQKYGEAAFVFEVIEVVPDIHRLIVREQVWLDATRAAERPFGFNLAAVAGSVLGMVHSAETRVKLRAAAARATRGPHKPESIERMRVAKMGKTASEETRRKMSVKRKGRRHTAEAVAKMIANRPKGLKHTADAISRMRAAKLGKKASAEAKAKMSATRKGRPHSPEHAAKLRVLLVARNKSTGATLRSAKGAQFELPITEVLRS